MVKTKNKSKHKTNTPEPRDIIGRSLGDDGNVCVECSQDDKFIEFGVEHLDDDIDSLKDFRKALKAGEVDV